MVNANPQQLEITERPVLQAVCDPSLKSDFMSRLRQCGFRTQTDAIITLARDFIMGKINYKGGMLQSQGEKTQTANSCSREGFSPPRTEANEKFKGNSG